MEREYAGGGAAAPTELLDDRVEEGAEALPEDGGGVRLDRASRSDDPPAVEDAWRAESRCARSVLWDVAGAPVNRPTRLTRRQGQAGRPQNRSASHDTSAGAAHHTAVPTGLGESRGAEGGVRGVKACRRQGGMIPRPTQSDFGWRNSIRLRSCVK